MRSSWVTDKDIQERAKKMKDAAFLDKVVGRCSGISYTYRDYVRKDSGLGEQPGPAIGDRAPDVDLPDGRSVFGLTRHTGFTLLTLLGTNHNTPDTTSLGEIAAKFGSLIQGHVLASSPGLERQYGSSAHDRLLLIRPDGYIGFHCSTTEVGRIKQHLDSFLC